MHVAMEWGVHPIAARATYECLERAWGTLVRNYVWPGQRKWRVEEGRWGQGGLGVFVLAVEMGAMFARVVIESPSEERKRTFASGPARDISRKWKR